MTLPIAYTYDADTHCPPCALARFGRGDGQFIGTLANGDPALDSEGNPVGVIAPWDEWCEPSEPGTATLRCGTCEGVIEQHDHAEPVCGCDDCLAAEQFADGLPAGPDDGLPHDYGYPCDCPSCAQGASMREGTPAQGASMRESGGDPEC